MALKKIFRENLLSYVKRCKRFVWWNGGMKLGIF